MFHTNFPKWEKNLGDKTEKMLLIFPGVMFQYFVGKRSQQKAKRAFLSSSSNNVRNTHQDVRQQTIILDLPFSLAALGDEAYSHTCHCTGHWNS